MADPLGVSETYQNYTRYVWNIVAPASLICSSLILTNVLRLRFRKNVDSNSSGRGGSSRIASNLTNSNPWKTYHRLMISIAIFDILFSAAAMFGAVPQPAELNPFYEALWGEESNMAKGTRATCTVQGFFVHLGAASFAYSQWLILHFLLLIRYNTKEQTLWKCEIVWHFFTICWYLGSAIGGIFLEVFNPDAVWCWVNEYPPFCKEIPVGWDCTRGLDAEWFGWAFVHYPLLVWDCLILLWLLVVVYTLLQRLYSSRKYVFGRTSSTPPTPGEKLVRRTITQCFLYSTWFSLNAILSIIGISDRYRTSVEGQTAVPRPAWMALLFFTLPGQGIVNFFIHIRPAYLNVREQFPQRGRLWAFGEAIWNPNASREDRERRGSTQRSSSIMATFRRKPLDSNSDAQQSTTIMSPSSIGSSEIQPQGQRRENQEPSKASTADSMEDKVSKAFSLAPDTGKSNGSKAFPKEEHP
jgi:hypothetical protein